MTICIIVLLRLLKNILKFKTHIEIKKGYMFICELSEIHSGIAEA